MIDLHALPLTPGRLELVDLRRAMIDEIRVLPDDRTLSVVFGHGTWQGLHHAEVVEDERSVTVTVFVGTTPEVARIAAGEELFFTMQKIYRRTELILAAPLAGREVRGASRDR